MVFKGIVPVINTHIQKRKKKKLGISLCLEKPTTIYYEGLFKVTT